jgi:hypothetical protein
MEDSYSIRRTKKCMGRKKAKPMNAKMLKIRAFHKKALLPYKAA